MSNIVFGTGPLGLSVANILKQQGKSVTLVSRSGSVTGKNLNSIRVIKGDANQSDVVTKICRDAKADTVYHCAMPQYTKWADEFPALTNGILVGAKSAGCKLVFGDNLYGYGDTQGAVISEELENKAIGQKGKVRATMAKLLLEEKDMKVVIGRGSDFYGPNVINSTMGKAFFENAILGKKVSLLGNIELLHTYTYIKDFANALVLLSSDDEASGQIWHVPNAPTISTRQFIRLVEEEINKPIKVQIAGRKMVSFLGLFNPMLRELKEIMYEWDQEYVVSHKKFKNKFGDTFTPHQVAIKETVEWWKSSMR